jgi:hypothetical protein
LHKEHSLGKIGLVIKIEFCFVALQSFFINSLCKAFSEIGFAKLLVKYATFFFFVRCRATVRLH